ncbi:MAG: hypothetical protein AB7F64_06020 [Gammaproteobacteria bacterium]
MIADQNELAKLEELASKLLKKPYISCPEILRAHTANALRMAILKLSLEKRKSKAPITTKFKSYEEMFQMLDHFIQLKAFYDKLKTKKPTNTQRKQSYDKLINVLKKDKIPQFDPLKSSNGEADLANFAGFILQALVLEKSEQLKLDAVEPIKSSVLTTETLKTKLYKARLEYLKKVVDDANPSVSQVMSAIQLLDFSTIDPLLEVALPIFNLTKESKYTKRDDLITKLQTELQACIVLNSADLNADTIKSTFTLFKALDSLLERISKLKTDGSTNRSKANITFKDAIFKNYSGWLESFKRFQTITEIQSHFTKLTTTIIDHPFYHFRFRQLPIMKTWSWLKHKPESTKNAVKTATDLTFLDFINGSLEKESFLKHLEQIRRDYYVKAIGYTPNSRKYFFVSRAPERATEYDGLIKDLASLNVQIETDGSYFFNNTPLEVANRLWRFRNSCQASHQQGFFGSYGITSSQAAKKAEDLINKMYKDGDITEAQLKRVKKHFKKSDFNF